MGQNQSSILRLSPSGSQVLFTLKDRELCERSVHLFSVESLCVEMYLVYQYH